MPESGFDVSPFTAYVTALEVRLELPVGFLESIEYQDEWSFIVKAHAFLEVVVTHSLTAVSDPRLGRTLGLMQLGGRKTGKLAFASALGLLNPRQIRFASRLGELRNTLVHDVRQVDFSFSDYFAGLKAPDFRAVARDLTSAFDDAAADIAREEYALVRASPRTVIYFTLLNVVSDVFCRIHPTDRAWQPDEISLGLLFMASVTA